MSPQEGLGGPCARRAGETTGVLATRPCSRPHSPLAAALLLLCSSGAGALLPPQHGGARAQCEAPARLLEGRHGPTPTPGNECAEGVTQPREAQAFCVPQALYREQLGPRRWRQPSRASWLMRGRMGPGEAAGDGVATALAWMDRTHSASGLTTCLIPRLGPFTARGPAGVGEQTPERRRQGRVRRGLCPYPHPEPRGSGVSACSSGAPSSGTCSG
nr:uncharacterized protein LOC115845987 [Globicephala melas]